VVLAIVLAAGLSAAVSGPALAAGDVGQTETLESAAPAAGAERPKVAPGSKAPDFQYQSYDQLWQNLHNVLEHGDVLLVFGASDVDLRTLEREREILLRSGITPLAVVEKNERDVWASVRRLGLTFSLLSDPRGKIGMQYGVFDPGLGRSHTSWFVIDRKGKVRQAGTTMPQQSWPTVAALALGRAVPGGVKASSKR
jgi:peroxiredoxin